MLQRQKYPRTWHLPYSNPTSDDYVQYDFSSFYGKEIIITEKMDGENTTIYADGYMHARTIDSAHHESRSYIKSRISPMLIGQLPPNLRVCGENLYAQHSVAYTDLIDYFYVFSIWDGDTCLSWDDTLGWCDLLGLTTVPVLFEGVFDSKVNYADLLKLDIKKHEGFVIRNTASYKMDAFNKNVVKYVRANHVQTDTHWMQSRVIKNKLIGD